VVDKKSAGKAKKAEVSATERIMKDAISSAKHEEDEDEIELKKLKEQLKEKKEKQ